MATPKKEPNGRTWYIRVSYTTADGIKEQKQKGGFKSANQAIVWAEKYREAAEQELSIQDTMHFYDLCDAFMKVKRAYKKKGKPLASRTIADYEMNIDLLQKDFGNLLVKRITPAFLQERYDAYGATPCKQAHIEQTLSAIFNFAELQGYVDRSPWKRVVKSEYVPKEENQVWYDAEQVKTLLHHLQKERPQYYTYAKLLALTGLRPNEASVIEESDFRFSEDENLYFLNINKALSVFYNKDGQIIKELKEPKSNAGKRVIPISVEDYDDLHKFKIQNRVSSPYLLVYKNGKHMTANAFYQAITDIVKLHNLPKITPYGLRRTFANLNKHVGVDPYTVAKLMGHSDVEVTNRHYFKNDIELNKNAALAVSATLHDQ